MSHAWAKRSCCLESHWRASSRCQGRKTGMAISDGAVSGCMPDLPLLAGPQLRKNAGDLLADLRNAARGVDDMEAPGMLLSPRMIGGARPLEEIGILLLETIQVSAV